MQKKLSTNLIVLQIEKQNLKIQKWVAAISVLLLAAKFTAYYLTNSVSILSDALESIVNVVAGFIGLYSLYVASKPRDKDHPYGHGKAEFISAAIEGTLVLAAGTLVIFTAVKNIFYPIRIHKVDAGLILITATAAVNYIMGIISIRWGNKNNSLALVTSGKHLQSDSFSTLGIMAGLVLIIITGYLWIDAAVAILVGVIIIYTAYKIIRKSIAGIMDEADIELLSHMIELLNANRRVNWVDMHNLRVIKYGIVLHVDCHLTVPWYLNVNEAHLEIDALSTLIRKEFGESLELFVHSDGCLYSQCPLCNKPDCPVRRHPFIQRIPWTLENIQQNKKHEVKLT